MLEDSVNKQRDKNGRFLPGNELGFQKGAVANPDGRPAKDICITSIVKEMLEEIAPGTELDPKTYAQLIAKTILRESTKGNIPALKELLDRIEGKVPDKHKFEDIIPISIQYVQRGGKG